MNMKKLNLPIVILSSLLVTPVSGSAESIAYAACKEPRGVVEVWKACLTPRLNFENAANCAATCGSLVRTCAQAVSAARKCLATINGAAAVQAKIDCRSEESYLAGKACRNTVKAAASALTAQINNDAVGAKQACRDYRADCINQCETPAVTYAIGDTGQLRADTCPAQLVTYAIGDTGPGGGTVFYLNEDGSGGLEAALEDQESAIWCNSATTDIATIENLSPDFTNTDDHSGAANTDAIIAACGNDSAAGVARAYAWPEGQTDGFLPNREELDLLFVQKIVVGGFADDDYWSSSESGTNYAWLQHFYYGYGHSSYFKISARRVRAVRAFSY